MLIKNVTIALDLSVVTNLNDWKILQKSPVKIDWIQHEGYPINRAKKLINHDLDEIAELIQKVDQYPTTFKRVIDSKKLDSNVVHIVLDMPFPFAERDYVVHYFIDKGENLWRFTFHSVKHPDAILKPGIVRLNNAAGIWILEGLETKKTMVTYIWNGELLGNFPDLGLTRAWITQGTEVLNWLEKAL